MKKTAAAVARSELTKPAVQAFSDALRGFVVMILMAAATVPAALGAAERSTPVGLWKTLDDRSGKPRGLVRVYEQDGHFFGRIEASLIDEENNQICQACTDERKNQPIIGLLILRDMVADGGGYGDGDILDPDSGSVYRCTLRLDPDGSRMTVRGYIGISLFGRSQTWVRAD